jgi:3-oxoacyl-[acyl-carrier protein] reductase
VDLGIAGKRAAVAAASQGLGRATAAALAAEGVTVAMCSRSKERIEAAAWDIPGARPMVADVGTAEGAAQFVRVVRDELGGLDILVANGGGPPPGGFGGVTLDQYRLAIEQNCLAVIAMCTEAVPAMQAQRWGRVLAITSIAVRQPIAGLILSNTARTGVTGFLKTLAREVAGDGVTVNSIQPGSHDTERIRSLRGGGGRAHPTGAERLGDPADFGKIAAFLCSEPANFLTGAGVHVDGGAYAALL